MRLHFNHLFSLLIAGSLAAGRVAAVTPGDLATRLAANERILLLDVRATSTYTAGHIPGAMNIPIGLLPYKPLPASGLIVVYGDGLGVTDDEKALSIVRSKPGVTAELLEGGYAAWMEETRLSTAPAGVRREEIPGITYQQLVASNKRGMVLVDLRERAAAPAVAASRDQVAASAAATDVLDEFAKKIGVPVVRSTAAPAPAQGTAKAANTPARAAAALATTGKSGQLLVLVADDNADADAVARQLRASGHHRFTVLIGGTEIIRREGRTGMGRMNGEAPVVQSGP